jgi:hypothetical protein
LHLLFRQGDVVHVRPDEFTRTSLPFADFDLPTDPSSGRIPEPFARQLSAARQRLADWRAVLEVVSGAPEEKDIVQQHVKREFEAWLSQTGKGAELRGLRTLKTNITNDS